MKPIPMFLVVAGLAACSTGPDGSTALGLKGSPAWFMTASPEAIAAHYSASCQSYGHRPGTAEMARCIERSAQSDKAAGRAAVTEASSRLGQPQPGTGYSSHRYNLPDGRGMTCNSYAYGGTGYTTTNCY